MGSATYSNQGRLQRFKDFVLRGISMAGFVVLGLAVSTGILTSQTSWASGVSVNSEAQRMASEAYSYPLQFDAALQTSVDRLRGLNPAASASATEFWADYVDATQDYGTALVSAADLYTTNYSTNQAGARDTYIDSFNNARSTYFNKLESARNMVVSELSGSNDPAKDMFVNEFNTARDAYNAQLENVKDQIAQL